MKKHALFIGLVGALLALLSAAGAVRAADTAQTYKVFIYAGQSNAQGKAHIAIAEAQAEAPATKELWQHLRKEGKWIEREDVFFRYASQGPMGTFGKLKIGMGSFRFGGDHEFATMMGEHFTEPVVISKSAYGGSSLTRNFRPPSAGLPSAEKLQAELAAAQKRVADTNAKQKKNDPLPTLDDIKKGYGELYRQILADYKEVTENVDKYFPELKGKKPELAGFVWFQGWNDQYGGQDEYAVNLKHFINDMRKDLGASKLPFVIVAMGQNGSKPAEGALLTIRDAQLSMNDVPEFKGNLKAFRSDLLVDKDAERVWAQKPRVEAEVKKFAADDAYHYYGSPIWYTRIGHAAGEAMLELLKSSSK
jgi:alpha-galactosidase